MEAKINELRCFCCYRCRCFLVVAVSAYQVVVVALLLFLVVCVVCGDDNGKQSAGRRASFFDDGAGVAINCQLRLGVDN